MKINGIPATLTNLEGQYFPLLNMLWNKNDKMKQNYNGFVYKQSLLANNNTGTDCSIAQTHYFMN